MAPRAGVTKHGVLRFPDLPKPCAGTYMHLGGNQADVPDTQNPGLAMTLVPKGTTGTRAVVKKRDTGIGGLSAGGLGAMRTRHDPNHESAWCDHDRFSLP